MSSAAESVKPAERERAVALSANSFRLAEYTRSTYVATIPHGTEIEDVLDPNFWAHVASSFITQMKPLDHIECTWEDFSMYAELLVIRPTKTSATVALLFTTDLRAGSADLDLGAELANYLIRFAGAGIGYRVIYKPDNTVLKGDGLTTEGMARAWLIAHLSDGTRAKAGAERGGDTKPKKAA